jgi:hypothetical protein
MKTSVMYEGLQSGSKALTLALALLMLVTVGYAQQKETWDIQIQNQAATLPFKTHVATVAPTLAEQSAGKVQLVFRIYGEAQNGSPLFEETQAVPISGDNLYAEIGAATAGGVPAAMLQNRQRIWVEYARTSAPELSLENRFSFTLRSSGNQPIQFSVDPSVCFTCGGAWPVYGGTLPTASGASERGGSCSGSIVASTDRFPFLCGRQ